MRYDVEQLRATNSVQINLRGQMRDGPAVPYRAMQDIYQEVKKKKQQVQHGNEPESEHDKCETSVRPCRAPELYR